MRFVLIIFIFVSIRSNAQYLPELEVAHQNGIRFIEVTNHVLPRYIPEHMDKNRLRKKEVEIDSVRVIRNYWLSSNGYLDSIRNNPSEEYAETIHFEHDEFGRLTRRERSDTQGNTKELETVQFHEDGSFIYRQFSQGTLVREFHALADSTLILSVSESTPLPLYENNIESGKITIRSYKDGIILHERAEQWIVNSDGDPDSLIVEFHQYRERKRKDHFQKSYRHELKLNPDGSIIPNDDFQNIHLNFYTRGMKIEAIPKHHLFHFKSSEVLDRSPILENKMFSGEILKNYESYRYESQAH